MTQFWVVEQLDVMKDIGTGTLACWVDLAANPLTLEQMEAAFSYSVVVAVAAATHAAGPTQIAHLLTHRMTPPSAITAGMTVYELAQPSNTMSSFMSFNKRVPHPDFLAKLV